MLDGTLMELLATGFAEAGFRLDHQQEHSTDGGGDPHSRDIGEVLWLAQISAANLLPAAARKAEALLDKLTGAIGTVAIWNPRAPYPLNDPYGTILGSSSVTINALNGASQIKLAGLPVGYVLTFGDFFHYQTGSDPVRRCLHKIVSEATANGSGVIGFLDVVPPLRAGVETGLAVTLKKAAAEMFILPGSLQARAQGQSLAQISFAAQQVP